MNSFVYVHKNPVSGQIFYVGIGKQNRRPKSKDNRNTYWKNYVKKHGEPIIEIIHSGLTWEDACAIEKTLIKLYGKVQDGGVLVNMTDGGEGAAGLKYDRKMLENKKAAMNRPEVKAKLRAATLKQWESEDFRKSISEYQRKNFLKNNPNNRPGVKEKQQKAARENNSFKLPEVRAILSKNMKERLKDPKTREFFEKARLKGVESSSIKVIAIDENGNILKFDSLRKAAVFMNVGHHTIALRLKKPEKRLNGYYFRFA